MSSLDVWAVVAEWLAWVAICGSSVGLVASWLWWNRFRGERIRGAPGRGGWKGRCRLRRWVRDDLGEVGNDNRRAGLRPPAKQYCFF